MIRSGGNHSSLGVAHFHGNGTDVFTVSPEDRPTGVQDKLRPHPGRLSSCRRNNLSLFHTARFNRTRHIHNAPIQMRITCDKFDADTCIVDEEFHALKVGVTPNLDCLPLFPGPVPVGKDV